MPGRFAVRNPTKKQTIGLPATLGFRRCAHNPISLNVNALETPQKKDPNTGRNDIGERERERQTETETERETQTETERERQRQRDGDRETEIVETEFLSPNFYVIMKILCPPIFTSS